MGCGASALSGGGDAPGDAPLPAASKTGTPGAGAVATVTAAAAAASLRTISSAESSSSSRTASSVGTESAGGQSWGGLSTRSLPLDVDMAAWVLKSVVRGQIARHKEAVLPAKGPQPSTSSLDEGLLIPQSPTVFVAMRDSALLSYIRGQDLEQVAGTVQDRKVLLRQLTAGRMVAPADASIPAARGPAALAVGGERGHGS